MLRLALPGPMSFDLKVDRKDEGGSDQHQKPQAGNACQGRIDGNGADDVPGDEKVEPQQHVLFDACPKSDEAIFMPFPVHDKDR